MNLTLSTNKALVLGAVGVLAVQSLIGAAQAQSVPGDEIVEAALKVMVVNTASAPVPVKAITQEAFHDSVSLANIGTPQHAQWQFADDKTRVIEHVSVSGDVDVPRDQGFMVVWLRVNDPRTGRYADHQIPLEPAPRGVSASFAASLPMRLVINPGMRVDVLAFGGRIQDQGGRGRGATATVSFSGVTLD